MRRWIGLCVAAVLVAVTSIALASSNRSPASSGVPVGYSMQ